jgi:hypothetical protein
LYASKNKKALDAGQHVVEASNTSGHQFQHIQGSHIVGLGIEGYRFASSRTSVHCMTPFVFWRAMQGCRTEALTYFATGAKSRTSSVATKGSLVFPMQEGDHCATIHQRAGPLSLDLYSVDD